uniref:Uncharacterized protein n=1 Tax=Tanacetum cinerariifolium TaxID=118510 RepID=A0A6L2L0L6_TANCI|nr:hypothetical protein [Tanacetum cinerariifolium]
MTAPARTLSYNHYDNATSTARTMEKKGGKVTNADSDTSEHFEIKESTSGKKIDFAHCWNKSVDRIFGPAIQDVSSL